MQDRHPEQAPERWPVPEGLRERKKRLMRQLISDTATGMFLEYGFDAVRVTEVAAACGVSEKTVYNYFPTKESLLLDREEAFTEAIRRGFGPEAAGRAPVEVAVAILSQELEDLRPDWYVAGDRATGLSSFRRFMGLIDSTPSLRAAQRDMMERAIRVAAEALAARAGVGPDDPEPQIAADALLGLWRIQFRALRRYDDGTRSVDEVFSLVSADVARAARLIDSGLWAFGVMAQGAGSRDQLRAAAESAQQAGRQVATALRQARRAWRELQQAQQGARSEGHEHVRRAHREAHRAHQQRRATEAADRRQQRRG